MQFFSYLIVVGVILGLCFLGMAVGLIFRNKTFRSCGSAARDMDGEPIGCAACGGQGGDACRRKKEA